MKSRSGVDLFRNHITIYTTAFGFLFINFSLSVAGCSFSKVVRIFVAFFLKVAVWTTRTSANTWEKPEKRKRKYKDKKKKKKKKYHTAGPMDGLSACGFHGYLFIYFWKYVFYFLFNFSFVSIGFFFIIRLAFFRYFSIRLIRLRSIRLLSRIPPSRVLFDKTQEPNNI